MALSLLTVHGDFQSVEVEEPPELVIFYKLSFWKGMLALSSRPQIHFTYHHPAEESANQIYCYKINHFNLFYSFN